jgi:hypothetical protein
MYHNFPVGFDQTICRLAASRGCHDIGVIVNEVFSNAHAKQFSIKIRTETASIRPSVSFEEV